MTALSLPMTLSTLRVTADVTPEFGYRTRQAQFGDGYIARRLDGLNPLTEEWPVQTPPLLMSNILTLETELKNLGTQPFVWTAPGDTEAKLWFLSPVKWRRVPYGHAYAALTFNIKRYYGGGEFAALPGGYESSNFDFLWCNLTNLDTNDNSAFLDTGPLNKSIKRLNGHTYIENTPSLTYRSEWAVEFVVKPLQSSQSKKVPLWDYNPTPPLENAARITIGLDETNRVFITSNGQYKIVHFGISGSPVTLTTGVWHHIALSVGMHYHQADILHEVYGAKIYINGVAYCTESYGGIVSGGGPNGYSYVFPQSFSWLGQPAGGAPMYIGSSLPLPLSGQELSVTQLLLCDSGSRRFFLSNRFGYITEGLATPTFTKDSWYHLALTVSGGVARTFVNGTLVETGSLDFTGRQGYITFFETFDGDAGKFGYVDELRITNNVSRYNASFTTPTAPFVLDSSDAYASNVVALLHMDGANNSTTFTNSSPSGINISTYGSIKLSTNRSKFGSSSCLSNSLGSKLVVSPLDFNSAFTIECWWSPNYDEPTGNQKALFSIHTQAGHATLYQPQAKIDRFQFTDGSAKYHITGEPNLDSWGQVYTPEAYYGA